MIAFFIRGLKEFGDTSRKTLIVSYSRTGNDAANDRRLLLGSATRSLSVGAILGAYLWSRSPRPIFSARRICIAEQSFT